MTTIIPNTTKLRLVIIDGHVSIAPKEPMLRHVSHPIVGWHLVDNDLTPVLPRLIHLLPAIDPDESGGVVVYSNFLHDPATGDLSDAHADSTSTKHLMRPRRARNCSFVASTRTNSGLHAHADPHNARRSRLLTG